MYSLSGSTVTLLTTLYGTSSRNSQFGYSVSVYSGYMVVGAYNYSKLKITRVRLYTYISDASYLATNVIN